MNILFKIIFVISITIISIVKLNSEWIVLEADKKFVGHPASVAIKYDTIQYNCINNVSSIIIKKEYGIPRLGNVVNCFNQIIDTLNYLDDIYFKDYSVPVHNCKIDSNNLKVFSMNDFMLKIFDIKTGNIAFNTTGIGQPDYFEIFNLSIGGSSGNTIDTANTTKELLGAQCIKSIVPVSKENNPGTIITMPTLPTGHYFIVVIDKTNNCVLFVKTITK